jgi:PleD family two-component response regulator
MEKVGETLREKILIVQDAPSYHTATPDLLNRFGYAASLVGESSRALDKITQESPDLVMLDLGMPGADGQDLCVRLKADPFTRHIPIVVLGTQRSSANRYHWLDSGADVCLDYPCNPNVLIAHVRALLKRSVEYDKVTHLPSGGYLHGQLDPWLAKNIPTAVMYVDIDHFASYKSAYGGAASERVLVTLAHLIVDALPRGNVSPVYLGEDDFMMVLAPKGIETIAQTLVERFRAAQGEFYNEPDLANGYIPEMDPFLPPRTWPLMTLSAALVTNERRALTTYVQVSSLLSKLMVRVKAEGGDKWAGDHPH